MENLPHQKRKIIMFHALVVLFDWARCLQHMSLIIATSCNSKKQAALDYWGHFFLACPFLILFHRHPQSENPVFFQYFNKLNSLFPNTHVVIENSNTLPKSLHCRQLPWNVPTTTGLILRFFPSFQPQLYGYLSHFPGCNVVRRSVSQSRYWLVFSHRKTLPSWWI